MSVLKYKNPTTQLWETMICGAIGGGGGTANGIPITSNPSSDTTVWIDPNEDISGSSGGGVQIATGKYIGSGTYGINNPNSLTFDFIPKMIVIMPNFYGNWGAGTVLIHGQTKNGGMEDDGNINLSLNISWDKKSVSWYTTGIDTEVVRQPPVKQLNKYNEEYYYFAIGDNNSVSNENNNTTVTNTISIYLDNYHYSGIPKDITWYEFVTNNTLGKTLGLACVGADYAVTQGTGPSVPGIYNMSTGIMVYGRDTLINGARYAVVSGPGNDGSGDVNGDGVIEPGEGSAGGYV